HVVVLRSRRGHSPAKLATAPEQDPYARLDLVGEIALMLARQHGLRLTPLAGAESDPGSDLPQTDDARRARESLELGFRAMAIRRFATAKGMPPGPPVPPEIQRSMRAPDFALWQAMSRFCGFFFVRGLIGDTGPLTDLKAAFDRPPSTMMEIFRPRWYQDHEFWRPDPVPADFASDLMNSPPALTDVLGISGLFAFLRRWYDVDESLSYIAGWTGDRWGIWDLPDGRTKMIVEIRWRDEDSAARFGESLWPESGWTLLPAGTDLKRLRMVSVR
ncbi:MAG: hypothetical protein AAGG01_22920, partial [Planctomycetota bacterium]